jgi:hypothetical protein
LLCVFCLGRECKCAMEGWVLGRTRGWGGVVRGVVGKRLSSSSFSDAVRGGPLPHARAHTEK